MQNVIGSLAAVVECSIAEGRLQLEEVPVFAKGYCAGLSLVPEARASALSWASCYVRCENHKRVQYARWS